MMADEESPKRWLETLPGALTAIAGVITAITGLLVALNQAGLLGSTSPPPASTQGTPAPAAAASSIPGSQSPVPKVVVEGPAAAPLGELTYYRITSQDAVRGVWSIRGFHDTPMAVEPLGPDHRIWVHPKDASRVGESFTIVFTAYGADGRSVSATKEFLIVSK
jgi:hypothetical protein